MSTTYRQLYSGRDLARALSIGDLRRMAQRALPRFLFEYIDGGAEDELSLHRNRQAFADLALIPDTLVDVATRNQQVTLLGRCADSPLVVSPTGFNGMSRYRADLLLARAAADAGIPFTLSMASNVRLEEVAEQAGGRLWMQLYWLRNRDDIRRLVARAEAAGYEALVVTTDVQVGGGREWDRRCYRQGMQLSLRSKLDVLMHPRWLWEVPRRGGLPRFANLRELVPADARNVVDDMMWLGRNMDPSVGWADIEWLRKLWPGKLLVKGILAVPDAQRALELGVDALVLSNHGGRQLDGAVSPVDVLPRMRQALGQGPQLLLDGGVRRGVDVVKALALGADAVMMGRPGLYGLAVAGEPGVRHAIRIVSQEIDRCLALLGQPDINAIQTGKGAALLHRP